MIMALLCGRFLDAFFHGRYRIHRWHTRRTIGWPSTAAHADLYRLRVISVLYGPSLLASYDGWLWNGWRGPRRINHWRLSSWGKEDFLLVRFLPFRFLLTRKMTERQVDGKCRPPVFCRTANAPNQQKEKRETSSVTDVFLIFYPTTLSFDSRSLFFKSMPVDQ